MMEYILLVALVKGNSIMVPDRHETFATYEQCQAVQVELVQNNREIYYNGRLILVCAPEQKK